MAYIKGVSSGYISREIDYSSFHMKLNKNIDFIPNIANTQKKMCCIGKGTMQNQYTLIAYNIQKKYTVCKMPYNKHHIVKCIATEKKKRCVSVS